MKNKYGYVCYCMSSFQFLYSASLFSQMFWLGPPFLLKLYPQPTLSYINIFSY